MKKVIIFFALAGLYVPAHALSTFQNFADGKTPTFVGTPDQWEINLSTCITLTIGKYVIISINGPDDWAECQTRVGLKARFIRIRPIIDALTSDFPASDPLLVDLKQRFGWLKSYYLTLP